MNAETSLSMELLETKYRQALQWSEKAVQRDPEIYTAMKRRLQRILDNPVDISEYYPLARELSGDLQSLSHIGGETIFHYFHPHIEPRKSGDPRYFRAMCLDLWNRVQDLDHWRISRRNLRIVR